ncbi:response regulator [Tardiphaga sp. 709]|uniref:response regulator n=1 Tax=Tardiphaga sp. 709 TaxID=3076039 RepID=UPI0028E5A5CE|nr:response regulator [Tardiphaga sp. 709]WNV10129.1 response regulator [Tardiphaga sp. 709]
MNLDFGILWIEDSWSPEESETLKRRIRESGFIARIETIANSKRIEDLARAHNLYHKYDLILLDYRLQDENGDEIAPRVRALFPSTNILFYSGTVDEQSLRELIAKQQVEGVYCSHRSRFIDRTGSLIDQTARALDRLSGMRGLAMRVVAECDTLMKSAMLSMCERDPNCVAKVSDLDKDVLDFIASMQKKYELAISGDLSARIDTRAVDSLKLFKHFRRLTQIAATAPATFGINEAGVERLRELRRQSAQYNENVLNKRNVLGHVVEVQSDDGWVLKGSDEIRVSDFPDIRRSFAAHIDAFREMGDLVIPLDAQQT